MAKKPGYPKTWRNATPMDTSVLPTPAGRVCIPSGGCSALLGYRRDIYMHAH